MSTFGSPLVKFSGFKGALISLVNNKSGTGKTTILKLINSVWGHPEETMLQKEDTYMSKQNRLGILNNLPATIDEITNMRSEEASDMAYAITLGRGRNRMEAAVNRERLNTTRWALIAVATGNSFLSDKLGALKATADGELMRIIEIEIALAENPDANELIDVLSENYGVAGETYIRYIINNRQEVMRSIDKMRARIVHDTKATRKERYWVTSWRSIWSAASSPRSSACMTTTCVQSTTGRWTTSPTCELLPITTSWTLNTYWVNS